MDFRSKTIQYDAQALFVSNSTQGNIPSGIMGQVSRLQSADFSVEYTQSDSQFLGTMKNDEVVERIIPTLNLSYYVTNGGNEKRLGFSTDDKVGFLYPQVSLEKDFFLKVDNFNGEPDTIRTLAFGNCALDTISYGCSYGSFLTASASFVGKNLICSMGVTGISPEVSEDGTSISGSFSLPPQTDDYEMRSFNNVGNISVLTSSDISVKFLGTNLESEGVAINSMNIQFSLGRSEVIPVGGIYASSRKITARGVRFTVSCVMFNYQLEALNQYLGSKTLQDIDIIAQKCCTLDEKNFFFQDKVEPRIAFKLRGMRLARKSVVGNIGQRVQVDFEYNLNIGDFLSLSKNFFASGNFGGFGYGVTNSYLASSNLYPGMMYTEYEKTLSESVHPKYEIVAKAFITPEMLSGHSSFDFGRIGPVFTGLTSGIYNTDFTTQYYSSSLPLRPSGHYDLYEVISGLTYFPTIDNGDTASDDPNLFPEEWVVTKNLTQNSGEMVFCVSGYNLASGQIRIDALSLGPAIVFNTPIYLSVTPEVPLAFSRLTFRSDSLDNDTPKLFEGLMTAKGIGVSRVYKLIFNKYKEAVCDCNFIPND